MHFHTARTALTGLILSMLTLCGLAHAETTVHGLIQAQAAFIQDDEPSFLDGGTGLTRLHDDNHLDLAHALLEFRSDLSGSLSVHAILNHTINPDTHTHFSQLSLKYKPIWSNKYRWQFRAGMFYPEFGFENPDIGWLSPYNYTNSAIASWVGEEVRTLGGEFKVTRPGRAHGNSPHTFAFVGAGFRGNDPAGTLLAWRGWALHDKQALYNEAIPFAQYTSIGPGTGPLELQAFFVEPFREVDGRWGYYLGAHWDYQKKSRVRYYYYNNNADENIVARRGQYAWHTRFHNVSWQYRFDRNLRLIAQYMNGNTSMGPGAVNVDFDAWFAMLSYKTGPHRVSVRFDDFKTTDRDFLIPDDNNNGDGHSIAATYRYNLTKQVQLGIEMLYIDSFQANRSQFDGLSTDLSQSQLLGVLQYRF